MVRDNVVMFRSAVESTGWRLLWPCSHKPYLNWLREERSVLWGSLCDRTLSPIINTRIIHWLRKNSVANVVHDKHSFDFSLTCIFMKLVRTGSAVVVTVRNYSPVCLWGIKSTVVLRAIMLRFMATENSICNLLAIQATRIVTDHSLRWLCW